MFFSLADVDMRKDLPNVLNQVLIDEVNKKDGVFRHEKIDRVGNFSVGEKVYNFFPASLSKIL